MLLNIKKYFIGFQAQYFFEFQILQGVFLILHIREKNMYIEITLNYFGTSLLFEFLISNYLFL